MKITSPTYRFLAVITILTVLGSLSLPACLYAKNQVDGSCPVAPVHPLNDMGKMMAGNGMQMQNRYQRLYRLQERGMDSTMACCLNPDQDRNMPFFKVETVSSAHTQATVLLPIALFDFTAEFQSLDRPHEILPPNLNSPPPPLFLVNRTFLN